MAAGRLSLSQYMPARDRQGRLVPGARLRVWKNRTTTNAAVFADAGLTTPLTNPVVANSSGQFPAIWVDGGTDDDQILFTLAVSDADGRSIGNPSVFDDVSVSVVYDMIVAATTDFTRSLLTTTSPSSFRLAIGAQSRVVIDVTDAPYFAKFDNVTNDQPALQMAANAAAVAGGATLVCPGGVAYMAGATLQIASGVSIEGKGRTATQFRKTTNYGPMIRFGTSASGWQGGYASSFWAYHDYGGGAFPPNRAVDVVNPSGTEAILEFYGPYNAYVENIWVCGGARQIHIHGGSTSEFRNCSTTGVYHPGDAGLQFSPDGVLIEVGPAGEIPTNLRFIACNFTGVVTPTTVSITWPNPGGGGPFVTTGTVRNIGPERLIHIKHAESIAFTACYFGASSKHNVAFNNLFVAGRPNIISGVSMNGCFMDAAHEEMVAFEGDQTSTSIELTMREWVGQNNGFGALTDKNYTGSAYSVAGLEVGGEMRAFIGPPIRMNSWRGFTVNSPIRWYNTAGFYTGLDGYNCAIWTGPTSKVGVINSRVGGDNACEPDSKTVVGVRIAAGATGIETKNVTDGGVAGQLVVGAFDNYAIVTTDANFTLRQRVNACIIDHLGTLTANRTITLDTTGANDGDIWRVTRSGGGAFNLNVAGVVTVALPAPATIFKPAWVEFRYLADTGQARISAWGGY